MASIRPRLRDDLSALDGYHSPQLDVQIRLNTNEAPTAPPAGFSKAFATAVESVQWNRYPDRSAQRLRTKLAQHHAISSENVFAANGSNEVIQTVLLAYGGPGRCAAVFEPTYAMHSQIARSTSTAVIVGERAEDFGLDLSEVKNVVSTHEPAVVFLCSPNSPTGMLDPADAVHEVLSLVESYGGLLFVDEAYGQFAASSAIELLAEDRSLIVSRTFSKTWSMAAARLGYLLGPSWFIESLDMVALPYHLDSVTQIAGEIALDFAPEMTARISHLVQERDRMVRAMTELPLELWPSSANFVLFRPTIEAALDGHALWPRLVERSILVRNCASWERLDGCLRVTVGTGEQDDQFIEALRELLG